MEDFEKWLDEQRKDKGTPRSYLRSEDAIVFALGEEQAYGTAIAKYRSMKRTCKMMAHNDAMNPYMIRYECSNCRERMFNPDKYCTYCGAEVAE